jgi:gluconokinase
MTSSAWFLGIDLGTGSCKAAAVDETGRVLGFGAAEYPGAESRQRWQEQEPQALLEALIAAVRQALERSGAPPAGCGGMSIGGAMHGVMALDERDRPLTGVITWADGRAVEQARAVAATPAGMKLYRETGCPPHGMYPLYKILWLREHRPEVFKSARRYVSAKEYAGFRLTGSWQIDYALAAGTGLLNTHFLRWSEDALALAGVRPEQLSPPASPAAPAGRLQPEAAQKMGLPVGTPVVTGSADSANSSLGAGAVLPTQATLMVGTSGALRVVASRPVLDARARSWCYAVDEAHWLVGGAINNGGVALAWLRDVLNQAIGRGSGAKPLSFEDILALAESAPVGSGGLICLPFFAGERSPDWNLNARAVFFGMTLAHEACHLARALLEGVGFRLRSVFEVLQEMEVDVRQVVASGGFTQSPLWLQTMADVLGRELSVPVWGETSALAAAFWPFLAAGGAGCIDDIRDWVRFSRVQRPVAEHAAVYNRIYPQYSRLYRLLTDGFEDIARLQNELKL